VRQVDALKRAAASKAKLSREAAEKGLLKVQQSGQPVTFAAVARAAGVSTAYLRRQKDLAATIVLLRADSSLREVLEPVLRIHYPGRLDQGLHDALPSDPQRLVSLVRDLEIILEAARWKLGKFPEDL
jgi:hypothetical protein